MFSLGELANVFLWSFIRMCGPWGFLIQLYSLGLATLLWQTPPEELANFPLTCTPKFMSWIPGWWQPPAELLAWLMSGQITSGLHHHLHGPHSLYDRITKGVKGAIVRAGANHSGVLVTIQVQKLRALEKKTTRVTEISTEESYRLLVYFFIWTLQGIILYYLFFPWYLP